MMQTVVLAIFLLGIAIVFYTYIGYGLLLFMISKLKGPAKTPAFQKEQDLPPVTLLIAAYNEEGFIGEKIANCLALDYPTEKLHLVFVTDGSTDRTPELVAQFPQVKLFHEDGRKGKIHAVNRVMKFVSTPITIFCDANTYLNHEAIRNIVRHFTDPRVGGVAGEKRIFKKESDNASGAGEGIYWKYESFLKRKDAEIYSIVGAAGELFAVRTDLFEAPDTNMIIEDFYMSMRITARGYRFAYEPEAYATETASASVEEEWKRKVRIAAGGFQAMGKLLSLLNLFRYGVLSFQYISHRVLRWTLAPISLVLILLSNLYLAITGGLFFQAILLAQLGFYALAFMGYRLRNKTISIKGFFVPYYFVVMNAAVFAGFLRHLRGKQSVVWERARRAELDLK
jgi:poly-beta-1,6-N-acetyl-D-glucosamine synthase